jgi:hypothetical protein
MNRDAFRDLVDEFLAPMLGAKLLDGAIDSSTRESVAAYHTNANYIALKPARGMDFRLRLNRAKAFSGDELRLARDFVNEAQKLDGHEGQSYLEDLVRALPRWVVAQHIDADGKLRSVLERLEEWSSQTYEGRRITCALGLVNQAANSGLPLKEYWEENYAPVLSNGFDTLVVIGSDEEVFSLEQLDPPTSTSFAPYRFGSIAEWTAKEEGRIGVTLNFHGEILVFQSGLLRFSKRSGRWVHCVRDNAVATMHPCGTRTVRTAIYESCLDVSFARTGGCLAVVLKGEEDTFPKLVKEQDRIDDAKSFKARLFKMAGSRPFQELDRRLRQELLALDGAVILDRDGQILAAGAIVKVEGGSEGGGRLAAAKGLSSLGLGIKISEDGPIDIFKKGTRVLEIGKRSAK